MNYADDMATPNSNEINSSYRLFFKRYVKAHVEAKVCAMLINSPVPKPNL